MGPLAGHGFWAIRRGWGARFGAGFRERQRGDACIRAGQGCRLLNKPVAYFFEGYAGADEGSGKTKELASNEQDVIKLMRLFAVAHDPQERATILKFVEAFLRTSKLRMNGWLLDLIERGDPDIGWSVRG